MASNADTTIRCSACIGFLALRLLECFVCCTVSACASGQFANRAWD